MKSILITGSGGLIGKKLTLSLAENNLVYAVSRSDIKWSHPNVKSVVLNLDNGPMSALPVSIDMICHLVQSENFREFPEKANEIFNVNTLSTMKLLDYAVKSGCKKFVYASSGGIYGNSNVGFNEEDPIMAGGELGFYLSTKYCSEILVENYARFFDTNILRFFFVYGKEQRKTMFIPRLVNSIKEGLPITLQGEEGIKVNPIHVSDAAKAIEAVLKKEGSFKMNIAGAEILSLRTICETIGNALGKKPEYITEQKEPKNVIGDISKMKKILIEPQVTFKEGIKELL